MVAHMLLLRPVLNPAASSAHQETIQQGLRVVLLNVTFHDQSNLRSPMVRYGGIVQVEEAVCVPEVVLNENDVFCFSPEKAEVDSPA